MNSPYRTMEMKAKTEFKLSEQDLIDAVTEYIWNKYNEDGLTVTFTVAVGTVTATATREVTDP